jgi:integrase
MKLTTQEIARYQPPEGKNDHIVFDSELSGFGLRYRSGKRTWVFQYAFGSGKKRTNARMSLGEYPALPAAKARDLAQDLYAKVRLGQHPAADKQVSRSESQNTFGRLVEGYLAHQRAELRDRSFVEAERYLGRYAKSLHGLPATAIDRRKIADLLDSITRERGAVSANRARSCLSAMFSWSMRRGLHDGSNPVIGTDKLKERTRDRILTDAEIGVIWNALGDDNYGNAVRLLLLTGQRAGEIGGLRWSEINFNESLISLPAERTKNACPHSIPLSGPARDILSARPQTGPYVFGRHGIVAWSLSKRLLDAKIASANLAHWTIHDLRRTFATGLQRLGIRLEVTEAILNHVGGNRAGVGGIYRRHDWATEKRQALDAWAAHVLAVVSGKRNKSNVTAIRGRVS